MNAMGLRRRKGDATPAVSREELASRTAALTEALDRGGDRVDPVAAARARAVVDKVAERTGIAGSRTVVALAGATGSGKSSLFNDLVGEPVAEVGARRPTTATPTAALWGDEPATELLAWLEVGRRHHVPARGDGVDAAEGAMDLDGLVLLDLPDFDSREAAHRVEADRVLELVDMFIWVTDPQKYADAVLHEEYIAAMADRGAATVVVLNQADRLTPEGVLACQQDLRRLLAADGVGGAEVMATSALQGSGTVELHHRIAVAVQGRNAAEQRLLGDIRSAAAGLGDSVATSEPSVEQDADDDLVEALSRAAGIPTVLNAVERDYRREAWASTGWPFTRWARALRPDPLKRLRLSKDSKGAAVTASDVRSALGRSSLPPPSPAARSAVALALHRLGDRAGEGLPRRWADAVVHAAGPVEGDLGDSLDQAVIGTPLRARRPLWWGVFNLFQWLFALAAVAGFLWLVLLAVLGWLQLAATFEPPRVGWVPWPALLLVGGLLAGLLLAVVGRALARVGGRRRRRVVAARLHDSVATVAGERIVAPIRAVLADHRATREALGRAGRAR